MKLATANENVEGHQVVSKQIFNINELTACQIVYINASEKTRLRAILALLKDKPVLTVSDMESFVIKGGMVQFYNRQNKVRFLIDPTTVREAGLEPNANLLRIADVFPEN